MAAAEARAAWQRTVNRCFVQEDAKRAPKLACCQSSSSTSKQVEAGPGTTTDGPDAADASFRPLHRNPSYGNLPPDARWWLLMQPSYVYQNGLACARLNALDTEEPETLQTKIINSTLDISRSGLQKGDGATVDGNKNSKSYHDVLCDPAFCINKASEVGKQDVNAMHSKNMEELIELDVMTDGYEMVKKDQTEYVDAKQRNEIFDSEYSWIGSEKTEPWWRKTDRDELVSLVARKSLDNVENCDLPPPLKLCHRTHPFGHMTHTGCFDCQEFPGSSLDWKSPTVLSKSSIHGECLPGFGGTYGRQRGMTKEGYSQNVSAKPFSCSTTQNWLSETQENCESDYNKEQLMAALCHSQTRAREAERAAKQAYAEKEHILTLFFEQASQLFAYKQWIQIQMLQLETLIPTLFPVVLPWMSDKGRKLRKSLHRNHRGKWIKQGGPSHDITKCAVSFALGLSLVGAGLLLGWTMGWMLPPFQSI